MRDATEHNLGDVGRNAEDVEALQQEHEKLEATARVRIMSVLFLGFGECFVLHVFLPPKELCCKTTERCHSYECNAMSRNVTEIASEYMEDHTFELRRKF